jgi:hypothetical protein
MTFLQDRLLNLFFLLCLSYYCLCLLFNKIGEKVRTGSAWKRGRCGGEGGGGKQGREMVQTMYAHVNKENK